MPLKEMRGELLGGENTEPIMQHDEGYDDDDDDEEALSFCEFSRNSTADHFWEESSRESRNSSFNSSAQEEDYFEFLTEEFRTNSMSYRPPENIVFCGKLIPSKKSSPERVEGIKGKIGHKTRRPESSKHRFNKVNSISNHDVSFRKISTFTSTKGKCRWRFFLLGITRFPTEMELRDMKYRQSRRSASLKSFTLDGGDDKNRNRGIWGLVRALSCGSGGQHRTDAVVQAAVGAIPRV